MFTIKYRHFRPSVLQDESDPITRYDSIELIDGPFDLVSQEMDDGYLVVHGHRGENMLGTTFGPVKEDDAGRPRPTVWVMNEAGATVSTYRL